MTECSTKQWLNNNYNNLYGAVTLP